ncbi:MAG: DUF456 domain-containing protein [Schaalia hyovaginalis]|nr:DUF456 domain-containing protein [Schaalia hyovaginalis]MCI6411146.1 DUF456 family protein [Schaalia hyovaginalis]MDD7553474.1 DUF456 domain-containing protein [Schaalia hyovaginalis]MDY3094308.1 DUF456 domain-containing protein [Schaalia hyovaginalis]MDY3665909.1 DUF456 domain-containing protein [Schaalia hyovaginalis]MDY4262197.1 DUF456 domain-containing protein [Schaalia hyovaginalis]
MIGIVNVLVGIAMLVGIIGAIVQVVPSGAVIGIALIVWAIVEGGATAWTITGIALLVLIGASVLKYLVPGKRLMESGTPNSTLLLALLVGVIGWFVVPVLGLALGAIGTVYLMERRRLGAHAAALGATAKVMKTLGLAILIELVAALVATSLWIVGLVLV